MHVHLLQSYAYIKVLIEVYICNSYTMGCPPVRGDNPRAYNEWIILRTGGQTWYNYFIPPTSV